MKEVIKLWLEYTNALINREKSGGAKYDDLDFTFDKFMDWVMKNYD